MSFLWNWLFRKEEDDEDTRPIDPHPRATALNKHERREFRDLMKTLNAIQEETTDDLELADDVAEETARLRAFQASQRPPLPPLEETGSGSGSESEDDGAEGDLLVPASHGSHARGEGGGERV